MRAPAKPKPRASDEVLRVVRTMHMLADELWAGTKMPSRLPVRDAAALLEVADRIAARTEG